MKIYDLLIEAYVPHMRQVLQEVVSILHEKNVNYVVGGANALSIFSNRPRTTSDIDVFVDISKKNELENEFVNKNFDIIYVEKFQSKFIKNDVEVDLLYAGNDAEWNAINTSHDSTILGVTVHAPTPEALLWLYIMSDKDQNFIDAIQLIRSVPSMNLQSLRNDLSSDEETILDNMIARASKITTDRKRK